MRTIIVCAGHSDQQSGAASPDGKHKEEELAQWLRNRVATLLRADGMTVLTDGDPAVNQSLNHAISLLKQYQNALAVEFHFNAGPSQVRGVEVLSKSHLKRTAQNIAAAIATITGSPLRGVLGWKADNSGQHHRLAFCEAGGLVVEVEFISNPNALNVYLAMRDQVAVSLENALREAAREG